MQDILISHCYNLIGNYMKVINVWLSAPYTSRLLLSLLLSTVTCQNQIMSQEHRIEQIIYLCMSAQKQPVWPVCFVALFHDCKCLPTIGQSIYQMTGCWPGDSSRRASLTTMRLSKHSITCYLKSF